MANPFCRGQGKTIKGIGYTALELEDECYFFRLTAGEMIGPRHALLDHDCKRMLPAARFEGAFFAAAFPLPEAGFGNISPMSVSGTGQRPLGEDAPGLVGRNGQKQLEIFAVGQGVVQRRRAVGQLLGQPRASSAMGTASSRSTAPQPLSSAMAASRATGRRSRRCPRAACNARSTAAPRRRAARNPDAGPECCRRKRRWRESGRRAGRRRGAADRGRYWPNSVMLTTSGPSQLFVSPPAMASPYFSASGSIPS